MLASEAIHNFLLENNSNFTEKYHSGMHVGVGVQKTLQPPFRLNGIRHYSAAKDNWHEIEIPKMTDHELFFNYKDYFTGISMSGWNWKDQSTEWVAVDLDAKSLDRTTSLDPHPIIESIKPKLFLPGIKSYTSTRGRGLHLYVSIKKQYTIDLNAHRTIRDKIINRLIQIIGREIDIVVDRSRVDLWVCHKSSRHLNLISNHTGLFTL